MKHRFIKSLPLAILAACAVNPGDPEGELGALEQGACKPEFSFPADMRANVGAPVAYRPTVSCVSPALDTWSFRVIGYENPNDPDYRANVGPGVTLASNGAISGTVAGSAHDVSFVPDPAAADHHTRLVRMCVGPRSYVRPTLAKDPKFATTFKIASPAGIYYYSGASLVKTVATDVVYKISGYYDGVPDGPRDVATSLWSKPSSASATLPVLAEYLIINGLTYERAAGTTNPAKLVSALAECATYATTLGQSDCRLTTQQYINACVTSADAPRCISQHSSINDVGNRFRVNDCPPGTSAVDHLVGMDFGDPTPLVAAARYPTTAWVDGALEERRVTMNGGTLPYAFAVRDGSSLPAGVVLDANTGRLSGRLSNDVSPFETTIVARDAAGREVHMPMTFRTTRETVLLRACAGLDLTPPCFTLKSTSSPEFYENSIQNARFGFIRDTQGHYFDEGVPPVGLLPSSIRSIWVAPGYEATTGTAPRLARDAPASVRQFSATARALGDNLVGTVFDQNVRSIEVRPATPAPVGVFTPAGVFPNDSESPTYAEGAQGIANDGANWYATDTFRIRRYPAARSLDGSSQARRALPVVEGMFNFNGDNAIPVRECDHVGDPVYGDGFLFVPADNCNIADGRARIYAFDRSFRLVNVGVLDQDDAGFVAFDPITKTLMVPDRAGTGLNSYDPRPLTSVAAGYYETRHNGAAILRNVGFVPLTLGPDGAYTWMQGGEFSPSGKFYLAAENLGSANPTGIYVFHRDGNHLELEALLGAGAMDYYVSGYRNEEVEGLTIWPNSGALGMPGGIRGDLHYMFLNNDAGDDNISLRHYSIDPTRL